MQFGGHLADRFVNLSTFSSWNRCAACWLCWRTITGATHPPRSWSTWSCCSSKREPIRCSSARIFCLCRNPSSRWSWRAIWRCPRCASLKRCFSGPNTRSAPVALPPASTPKSNSAAPWNDWLATSDSTAFHRRISSRWRIPFQIFMQTTRKKFHCASKNSLFWEICVWREVERKQWMEISNIWNILIEIGSLSLFLKVKVNRQLYIYLELCRNLKTVKTWKWKYFCVNRWSCRARRSKTSGSWRRWCSRPIQACTGFRIRTWKRASSVSRNKIRDSPNGTRSTTVSKEEVIWTLFSKYTKDIYTKEYIYYITEQ